MKTSILSILFLGFVSLFAVEGASRDAEWAKVEEARKNDQPKTEIGLLEEIGKAAFAEGAWGEGVRALVRKTLLEGQIEGTPAAAVKLLDERSESAPAEARPVLRAISAHWLLSYYRENQWRFMRRTTTASEPGDDLETWDLARILDEIDRRFRGSLEDAERLKSTPVSDFDDLLEKGELEGDYRPTMFDFLAHQALDFYSMEEVAVSRPVGAFEVEAGGPAFGGVDEFLGWSPETVDEDSPKLRAFGILRDLLDFHRNDENREAFLYNDLVRLRWADGAAVGESKDERYRAALRRYVEEHAGSPLSAWARVSLAESLIAGEMEKEAHEVAWTGAGKFPDHAFGRLCNNVVLQLEERQLSLVAESHWTPATEEIRVGHRNIDRVWFRLYPMPFEANRETLGSDPVPNRGRDLRALLERDPVRSWSAELPDDGDFKSRESWVTVPEGLEPGYHVLVAGGSEDFASGDNTLAVCGVRVTTLGMTVRGRSDGKVEGFVVDAVTGAPRAGVDVDLWFQRNDGLRQASATTGDDGSFVVSKQRNDHRLLAIARDGASRAVVRSWAAYHGVGADPYESVVFFTDRAIYRPGQTVHFKGILCSVDQKQGKYEVLGGRTGTVFLHDPNGKEAGKVEVTTNGRGSFSGTFTAPEGSVLGMCRISWQGTHHSAAFRVEEYKRPKFFAEVSAPGEAAVLGAPVSVKARAEAYTGAAIDGAKVEWRVTRTTRYPGWLRFCWWYFPPSQGAEEIAHGTSETDVNGEVAIGFVAKPDRSVPQDVEPVFDYEVTVDITDGSGETRSATRLVSVAYTSLRATVLADEWLVAGEDLEFRVRTESHDAEAREAEGVLKVHRLKEPEKTPRPDFNQGHYHPQETGRVADAERPSPDPNRWELGEVVAEIPVRTDAKGGAVVKQSLDAGAYRLVFETKDVGGREVKGLLGIQVVDPVATELSTKVPFLVSSPSWTVEPGGDFELLWGSGHGKARACVEFWLDGELIGREWSAEGRTQQRFTLPLEDRFRGGVTATVWQVTENRVHRMQRQVEVPWTNKRLSLSWERIVSKLEPGSKESWTAVVSGPDGEALAAEMVATLYDASLDAFMPHSFRVLDELLRRERFPFHELPFSSMSQHLRILENFDHGGRFGISRMFDEFRREFMFRSGIRMMRGGVAGFDGFALRAIADESELAEMAPADSSAPMAKKANNEAEDKDGGAAVDPAEVPVRTNLNETAFFFPQLTSGADGKVRMTFTMPEALTKWRFLGVAHDEEFRSGLLEGETVTAKDLMVQPNPPRFLREGDGLWFTVKVTNQSDEEQSGVARLNLFDAATDEDVSLTLLDGGADGQADDRVAKEFTVPAKQSRTLKWRLSVPDGAGFLKYRAVASSGSLSDGEEGWLPVIPRRILVTESMALPIRDAGTKEFEFGKLLESGGSESLENRFLHVQVVSQPAWYAVMALPYLMEYPHECAEQIFNRYYANALGEKIAGSDPKMRRIFDQWKRAGRDTLDSPLMKNQDLKGIMLEETPWFAEAENEAAARRRVGLLFDENHMDAELRKSLTKLVEMQGGDGMWPWFPGGMGNEYITLYITTGFARLRALEVETDITPALRALPALDRALTERYDDIVERGRLKDHNVSPWIAHHLYTRSFFLKDVALQGEHMVAFDYFAGQLSKWWTDLGSRMSRAHAALALRRIGDAEAAGLITRSLREHAVVEEELGMYWKDGEGEGWWWWQAPIETQAMMIEAFREIDGDEQAVEDCQVWLLKQKQVQDWRTTKATADAVYALLMGGRNLLGSDALLEISLGGERIEPEGVEAGTGMYEARIVGNEVKPDLGNIELKKTDEGVSWASVHWQYLEDMEKVTSHDGTPLKLEKSLFLKKNSDEGRVLVPLDGPVEVGDELVTRVVLRTDRAMEFVHLKDLRGSGTEPMNVLSGYRWQDGFGYYEVTRDTASHFFIDRLPPGTHVFETSVRVQHAGEYQTGIAEIRCMYAPEFNAHSGSVGIVAE